VTLNPLKMLRRWHRDRSREVALKTLIEYQLNGVFQHGVSDEFQRGYMCALYHTWESAGYPGTAAAIAARGLVTGTWERGT
jgi:hypothetical protein